FDSDIMFGPDSYQLLPEGRRVLNTIVPGIRAINDYIATVEVEGHTAPLPPGQSGGTNDWQLSGMRAATVVTYLDGWHKMVDEDKFTIAGFGPHRPHYSLESEETRARNRRVELVITRNNYSPENTNRMIDLLTYDYRLGGIPMGPDEGRQPQAGDFDRGRQIRNRIMEKYGVDDGVFNNDSDSGSGFGPVIPGTPVLPEDPTESE
ncbi:MAG: OmpA family protein, partial [Oscillospiraceae bacterium]|nr:OmpA family protein [Oscillospiraceae bacterium]